MEELSFNIVLSPFALKLRNLRLKKHISYKEVSLACHVGVKELILFETDQLVPTESTKKELLDFLSK